MPSNASRACCPSTPTGWRRSRPPCRSTRPSASSPTRTGRTTRVSRRCRCSRRWWRWPCRTSCRRRWAWPWPWPSSGASPGRGATTIGNFWVDLTRGRSCGCCSRCRSSWPSCSPRRASCRTCRRPGRSRPSRAGSQTVPGGMVASQEAIKELGTNGGGYFNANSAHPFENPNGLTNLIEMWALLAIPFALTFAYGRLAGQASGDRRDGARQGWVVFGAMLALWLAAGRRWPWSPRPGATRRWPGPAPTRRSPPPSPAATPRARRSASAPPGAGCSPGRTTGTSTGAVNCAHDSMTPLGGARAAGRDDAGEVSPGGVGAGLYGMLVFVLLAVFIAGLMVGRTPEYLGKKIQATEMKLVVLYILFVPAGRAGLLGGLGGAGTGPGLAGQPGPPRADRDGVRLHVGREQQRLGLRRADRQHRLVQHHPRPVDARRPVLPHRARAGHRRLAGPQAPGPGHGRHLPHRHARCSGCCSSASC